MELAKTILGYVATLLVFIGYIPYIKDVVAGKTKPHIYSWILWGLVTAIAFALQYSAGAGSGSFVTLAAALMCGVVIVLSLKAKSQVKIVLIDTVFLLLAFLAIALWLVAKQPVLSAVLVTAIDVLGFLPTVRKSWHEPESETVSFYFLNTARFMLSVVALQSYSIVTTLYPVSWLLINFCFGFLLIVRKRMLREKS